jgi:hypothetical protein
VIGDDVLCVPAWVNACASLALARSTNPADTLCPSSIATKVAAPSVGTFPKLVGEGVEPVIGQDVHDAGGLPKDQRTVRQD